MDFKRLKEAVFYRLSHRKYERGGLSAEELSSISEAFGEVKPLYSDIRTELKLVTKRDISSLMPWLPEDAVAIFSEEKDGYLENVGFMLEQVDLLLQSLGIGACWVGLARVKNNSLIPAGMSYVILLSIGRTKESMREGASGFKRKALSDISDSADPRLEPARLAPSSVNSQPWYFALCEGGYHVYKRNLVRTKGLARMNTIDVGIALACLYVCHPESFSAVKYEGAPELDGMTYITTVSL
ncbi:MAG: nitroreductase [Clostridia bacterium]|nr:nitroreductase [Clostridia bacterium]